MCRVDFFKSSGKWRHTVSVSFHGLYHEPLIHDALEKALARHFSEGNLGDWRAGGGFVICLQPYHVHEHPISILID